MPDTESCTLIPESLSRRGDGRQGPARPAARRRAIYGCFLGNAYFLGPLSHQFSDFAGAAAAHSRKTRRKWRDKPALRELARSLHILIGKHEPPFRVARGER
jgi:hypothetical protein